MTRKNPERPQELIMAAQQHYYAKGYENTSVNDIIHAVSVSSGAFYHHFDSKTAVLDAMIGETITQLYTVVQEGVADASLSAIPKWQKLSLLFSSLQTDRKEEIIEAWRALTMEENILMLHKLRAESFRILTAEMSKVIAQGAAEGVFH